MKFDAVTTFNREGLEKYGRRMVEGFEEFWPAEVNLSVFAEGWGNDNSYDLLLWSRWLEEFKYRHQAKPTADFRKDAVRFSHKVAALCLADYRSDADVLIWLDGDIVTHSPISVDVLEEFAPKGDEWIAWLDRTRMYPECGFYMLNRRHPKHSEYLGAFEAMYVEDKLFRLPEWHDSYVLQHVVKQCGALTKSLSGEARDTAHPLINCRLGAYFDHLKGPRKSIGRSHASDLLKPRTEPHWR